MSSSFNPAYYGLIAVPVILVGGMVYYLRLSPEGRETAGKFFRPALSSNTETAGLHREAIAVATGQRPGFKAYKERLKEGDLSTPLINETDEQRIAREKREAEEDAADEAQRQQEDANYENMFGPLRASEGGKVKHKKSRKQKNRKTRKGRKHRSRRQ
jgi:hypothetical protein